MQYRNHLTLLICLLIVSCKLSAQQDITGLWKGFMYNDTTQLNYRYEIAISEEKGKLYGYTQTYFIIDDKEYYGVKKIKIKRDGNEVVTEDVDLIGNNYPVKPPKGIRMQNTLRLTIKDSVMILSGLFETNRTRDFSHNTGFVHVERKRDYQQSSLVPYLQEKGLSQQLSFIKEDNNGTGATETLAVLKPMPTPEEEQMIVINAKKQQTSNTIQPSTTAAIKIQTPKLPEPVAPKPEPVKQAPPVVAKVTTVPPKETPAAKPVEAPKKTETVVVKPAPVPPPVTKPVETVVAKPAPVKQPDPIDPTAAVDAAKRKVENIQALYFKSDSLQLILYDNGEVDGDTVSVIMNGQVIMPRVGLTTNAVKKTIDTRDVGDSIQLVMYAETLGTLPPNTGLLIVYDGNDRYEIRFSGDMQKSSGIVFRRRKVQ
ncbi:MAG: hypothetical protein JST86_00635 [Bacteroidetes bacterium]|nr:hypothetical protein [Bacteroidota bacterium]